MSHKMKWILIVIAAVLFAVIHYYWDWKVLLHPDTIQQWLGRFGMAAPFVFMIVMALAIIISPIPSLPLDIAAGAFFGPFLGTLYAAVGALGGAVLSFLLARFLGRDLIERFLSGHVNFCTQCSDKVLAKIVFISRLIPVVSFDIISYGAGLTKMSLLTFSLSTFFGMLPLTFAYTTFGASFTIGFGWMSGLGIVVVLLFFLMPRLMEKMNWMEMDHHADNHDEK